MGRRHIQNNILFQDMYNHMPHMYLLKSPNLTCNHRKRHTPFLCTLDDKSLYHREPQRLNHLIHNMQLNCCFHHIDK